MFDIYYFYNYIFFFFNFTIFILIYFFLIYIIQAGIDGDNLIIALEPEAASMFCKYMLVERGNDSLCTFQPGSKYIILDCGG
jgi:hypothetical protein